MATLPEIQAQAVNPTDSERASLPSRLPRSLPPLSDGDDDGLFEAMRREAGMDADPSMSITLEELKRAVGR